MNILDKLDKINTATKYPSIPTYHEMNKGILGQDHVEFPNDTDVLLSEKIDGTSARISLIYSWEYLIGSRETLLTASGDIVYSKDLRIVETLLPTANSFVDNGYVPGGLNTILTVYGEVYGGKVGPQWKNYTSDPNKTGFRIFDIAVINDVEAKLDSSLETISNAREDNIIQEWYTEEQLQDFSKNTGVPLTKRLFIIKSQYLPTQLTEMQAFMQDALPHTQQALSNTSLGKPEGIVLRTSDRSVIAKARFEDYSKTLKKLTVK